LCITESKTSVNLDAYRWRHCPGVLNPADLPSRGLSASELTGNRLWWEGPAFLQISSEKWPLQETVVSDEHAEQEILKVQSTVSHVFSAVTTDGSSTSKP